MKKTYKRLPFPFEESAGLKNEASPCLQKIAKREI